MEFYCETRGVFKDGELLIGIPLKSFCVLEHFRLVSNELTTARVRVCWNSLLVQCISYSLVSVDIDAKRF